MLPQKNINTPAVIGVIVIGVIAVIGCDWIFMRIAA